MKDPSIHPNRLLNQDEAAKFLAVSPRTLETWRVNGKGPVFVKMSRRAVRYRLADLVAFIDEKTVR